MAEETVTQRVVFEAGAPARWAKTIIIADVVLAVVVLLQGADIRKLERTIAQWRPMVVRINDTTGLTDVVRVDHWSYVPQEHEIRYFLDRFVKEFYGRNPGTASAYLPDSLFFLSDAKLREVKDDWDRNKVVEMVSKTAQPFDIEVKNVIAENLKSEPYQAVATFVRVPVNRVDASAAQASAVTIDFVIDPAKFDIDHNPLAISIITLHEDEAFAK